MVLWAISYRIWPEKQRTFAESPFNPVDRLVFSDALLLQLRGVRARRPLVARARAPARRAGARRLAKRSRAQAGWRTRRTRARSCTSSWPAGASAAWSWPSTPTSARMSWRSSSRQRRSSSPGALPPRRRARLRGTGLRDACRARRVRLPGVPRDRRQLRGLEGGLQPLLQGGHPLPARGGRLPVGRGVGRGGAACGLRSFQGRQPRRVSRRSWSTRAPTRGSRASTTTTGRRFWTIRRRASHDGRFATLLHKTVPESSAFGMILERRPDYRVVQSSALSVFQHEPFTWQVDGDDFVYQDALNRAAVFFDEALDAWLRGKTPDERERFIDTIYELFASTEASTWAEFQEKPVREHAAAARRALEAGRRRRRASSGRRWAAGRHIERRDRQALQARPAHLAAAAPRSVRSRERRRRMSEVSAAGGIEERGAAGAVRTTPRAWRCSWPRRTPGRPPSCRRSWPLPRRRRSPAAASR